VAGLWRRSLQQVRQLEIGLAARGFSGELKVLPIPRELSQRRLLLTGGLLAAVAAAGLALDQALTR
jgi:cobalt/nickel transport system permease protein